MRPFVIALVLGLLHAEAALAVDLSDCSGLGRLGRGIVQNRDRGVSREQAKQTVREALAPADPAAFLDLADKVYADRGFSELAAEVLAQRQCKRTRRMP